MLVIVLLLLGLLGTCHSWSDQHHARSIYCGEDYNKISYKFVQRLLEQATKAACQQSPPSDQIQLIVAELELLATDYPEERGQIAYMMQKRVTMVPAFLEPMLRMYRGAAETSAVAAENLLTFLLQEPKTYATEINELMPKYMDLCIITGRVCASQLLPVMRLGAPSQGIGMNAENAGRFRLWTETATDEYQKMSATTAMADLFSEVLSQPK